MIAYKKLLKELYALNRSREVKWNLKGLLKLAQALNFPQNKFPSIHVAGTNGKGSVCFKIAETLRLSGYRVGLFSSPHLFDYRERIKIDGILLSREEVREGLETLFSLVEKLRVSPKFFELTTLLGFITFARHQVDVAVIEAGLGGRLDATNIITPLISVITSIDLDHCAILGSTLDAIAEEKAGIIKEKVPLVLGQRAHRLPIIKQAKKLRAPLYLAEVAKDPEKENYLIAKKAMEILTLHFSFSEKDLEKGLSRRLSCRYDVQGNVIFDVAHNGIAFRKLFEKIKNDFPERPIHILFGIAHDKNLEACLSEILPHVSHIHLFSFSHPRLITVEQISAALRRRGYNSFSERLDLIDIEDKILLVAGSFYIMEEAISLLRSFPLHQTSCEFRRQKDKTLSLPVGRLHLPSQSKPE